jgi:hypothetical protein
MSKLEQKITVPEAAKIMGVTPMFLRIGLRNGKFPFGTAIKFRKRWSYYINPERFEKWMAGEDLGKEEEERSVNAVEVH